MPVTWARDRVRPEDRERYQSGGEALAQRPPGRPSKTLEYRWVSNSRTLATAVEGRPAALQPLLSPEVERAREGAEGRIRILLADDHAIVRQGLLRLLQDQPDFVIVGEAEDGLAAVEMAQTLRPDVVLMDLAMPNMDGIEATRRIAAELPSVRVIGLSMYDDEEKEDLMRRAGARGYVAKGGPPGTLFATIRADQEG